MGTHSQKGVQHAETNRGTNGFDSVWGRRWLPHIPADGVVIAKPGNSQKPAFVLEFISPATQRVREQLERGSEPLPQVRIMYIMLNYG